MIGAVAQLFTRGAGPHSDDKNMFMADKPLAQQKQNLTTLADNKVPGKYKVPITAFRNASRVGGYAPRQRQQPPRTAYADSIADNWYFPVAIQQRMRQPAWGMEVFQLDPRGILGQAEYDARDRYFSNMALRDQAVNRNNRERTPMGLPLRGKWHKPKGVFITTIDGPTTNQEMPVYRGY